MIERKISNIYYLGPKGTNTYKAMDILTSSLNIKYEEAKALRTVKSIIKAVDEDTSSYGIVPVENSTEGIVREAIDNIIRVSDGSIKILAEIVLAIDNCLLARTEDLSKIKFIHSHPQALAQCAIFIEKHYPNAKILGESSTSAAANHLLELDETHAAIANCSNADFFGLKILHSNISDEPGNKTRFILIGRGSAEKTGEDKTSIAFATKNKAGALFKIIEIFNRHNINLIYIDSRPSKRHLGEYNFFIDFEGHIEDEKIKIAIGEIREHVTFFRLNGSFATYKNGSEN